MVPNQARSGRFVEQRAGSDGFAAFIPSRLVPNPAVDLTGLEALLDRANQALGRLDGVTLLLPDADYFLYAYLRKEAVLSSQIEGTQSSLSDLLLFERDEVPGAIRADVAETANYLAAVNQGLDRVRRGEPLSLRLLRDLHRTLLRGTRGGSRAPGDFRRIQNWIGGTGPADARFVPPPPQDVPDAMADLENFLNTAEAPMPILVRAALAHSQFETIHPFLDGNGRIGRLLVTLLLCADREPPERAPLSRPLLYLSLYLKQHRDEYYERLQRVRTDDAWEAWVSFFLSGVIDVAEQATDTTGRLIRMIEQDRADLHDLGRAAGSAQLVHGLLARDVVLSIPSAARELPVSEPTVASAITNLQRLGITREMTGRRRGRLYAYDRYLAILNEGTEPA